MAGDLDDAAAVVAAVVGVSAEAADSILSESLTQPPAVSAHGAKLVDDGASDAETRGPAQSGKGPSPRPPSGLLACGPGVDGRRLWAAGLVTDDL